MRTIGVKAIIAEIVGMTAVFAAMLGYAFVLLGQVTISKNLALIYFLFIASVLVRFGLFGQSKVAFALVVLSCAVLGALAGYSLNPPEYSLVGHIIFCIVATWFGWAIHYSLDIDREIS